LAKALAKVNDTQLAVGASKKKRLLGGETISLRVKNAFESKEFGCIFCLVNTEPENKLKRNREDGLEHVSTPLSEFSKKFFKIEDNLEKELS